jgi:hypothetical protein
MAEEVQIAGTPATAKIRSIWWVPILSIITIGIYFFCWYYFINREMRDLGRARGAEAELGDSPGKSLLAVTLGALIIIPALVSLYHTGQRIQAAQRVSSVEPTMSGWLSVVMYIIFSPVMFAYWQSELNKVWARVGQPGAADGAPSATTPM